MQSIRTLAVASAGFASSGLPGKTLALLTLKILVLFAIALPAYSAAGFNIQPLRLDLSARQKNASIELTNLTGQAIPIQIKLFAWSQKDGQEVLEPSRDVFFAPPITNVTANSKQVVRFRLKRGADVTRERSYRVFIEQLPPNDAALRAAMDFRVRFSIPLFVSPINFSDPSFTATATPVADGLRVQIANPGNTHIKIKGVTAYRPNTRIDRARRSDIVASATNSRAGTTYLLPGTTLEWLLPLSADSPPAEQLKVGINTDFFNASGRGAVQPDGVLIVPATGEVVRSANN